MKSAIYSYSDNLSRTKEEAVVEKIIDSLVYLKGFEKVRVFEEIVFEEGSKGYIFSIDRDHAICLLTTQSQIKKGVKASRSDRLVGINLGESLKGKMINPFGESIDKSNPVSNCKDFRIFDTEVPTIKDRAIIDENLHTGVTVVDMMVPLGKGQRELVIGERGTGKNWFANSVIKSAASSEIVCIYCGIGKKKSALSGIMSSLKNFEFSNHRLPIERKAEA